jgi:predicted phage tail protein
VFFEGRLYMVTIRLVGFEGKPQKISFDVSTYKQALEALKVHPDFDPRKVAERYECGIDEIKDSRDLVKQVGDVGMTLRYKKKLNPMAMAGSGNANVRIVIGVILIVIAAFFIVTGNPATGAEFGKMALLFLQASFAMGIGLVVGGIIEKLQDPLDDKDNKDSRVSRRYPNTVQSGTVMPLIFGTHRWGGHLFTMNIESSKGRDLGLGSFAFNLWDGDVGWDSWNTLYQNASTLTYFDIHYDYDSGGKTKNGVVAR